MRLHCERKGLALTSFSSGQTETRSGIVRITARHRLQMQFIVRVSGEPTMSYISDEDNSTLCKTKHSSLKLTSIAFTFLSSIPNLLHAPHFDGRHCLSLCFKQGPALFWQTLQIPLICSNLN